MSEDRAASFLQMIRRSQRGRLKVYLGFAPGVGKTYLMLQEGHRLKTEGVDLVIGLVEHHGRADTMRLVEGLEQIPLRKVEYHGITVEEMDVDAILARRPQVCLVDELAHTNVPGRRNQKRYEDVLELLAAGIHVISTLNIQHLESLYNTVEQLIGVKVRERIPDSVLADADEVVNVDLAADDLTKRLREGKIYPAERIETSLENFFTGSNLQHLRELALRELASQIDTRRRESRVPGTSDGVGFTAGPGMPDQLMVCLSSRGPNSTRLLRFGSRLAGRLNRNWYAVYVQTPREEPTVIDATTQRLLADTLTLANQLGATVFTFKGADVAETILRFANEYRVGQIVIGSPHPIPWWRRVLLGRKSVAEDLLMKQRGVTVIVVDADGESSESVGTEAGDVSQESRNSPAGASRQSDLSASEKANHSRHTSSLASMLSVNRIVIVDEPVTRECLFQRMLRIVANEQADLDVAPALRLIDEREARGSTFLNEGVALPHARIPHLARPVPVLAITRAGVLDAPTPSKTDVVLLLLTPADDHGSHLELLAAAGRAFMDRGLRRRLQGAQTPHDVLKMLGA